MENIQELLDGSWDLIVTYGGSVVLAVIVLVIGLAIIKKLTKVFRKTLAKRDVDESLVPFLSSLVNALMKIMLIISIASMIGIEMTSFVAILAAGGLAVGLALQGSLSNFAGGVLIIILKPFKVGDVIDGAGVSGSVREIQIFYTYLTTATGQEIMVPNGSLSNNSITNFSYNPTRRIDTTFGIGYSDDLSKAKAILHEIAAAEKRFLDDKGITIFVEALADSSVNIRLRGWSKNEDYWGILGDLNETVKKAFDAAEIGIPYPQMDLHLVEDSTK
jgi:small conductance mechanosensitive channel